MANLANLFALHTNEINLKSFFQHNIDLHQDVKFSRERKIRGKLNSLNVLLMRNVRKMLLLVYKKS